MRRGNTPAALVLSLAVGLGTTACSARNPAKFWRSFNPENQVSAESGVDHQAITWQADPGGRFDPVKVLAFAQANDWHLQSSIIFPAPAVAAWRYHDQPVFPLGSRGFSPKSPDGDENFRFFPRRITSPLMLYTFEIGKARFDKATGNPTNALGYLTLSQNQKQMAVYMLWGQ